MILSNESLLSNAQAVTATGLSTNVIDTGAKGTPVGGKAALLGDVGKGTKIPFVAQVVEAFDKLTSLTISVETGASASLGTVLSSQTILLADLTAGKRIALDVVPEGVLRYIGVRYTVTGTTPTTGKVTAGITHGAGNNVHGV